MISNKIIQSNYKNDNHDKKFFQNSIQKYPSQ
jgi:hypothetical protein